MDDAVDDGVCLTDAQSSKHRADACLSGCQYTQVAVNDEASPDVCEILRRSAGGRRDPGVLLSICMLIEMHEGVVQIEKTGLMRSSHGRAIVAGNAHANSC